MGGKLQWILTQVRINLIKFYYNKGQVYTHIFTVTYSAFWYSLILKMELSLISHFKFQIQW